MVLSGDEPRGGEELLGTELAASQSGDQSYDPLADSLAARAIAVLNRTFGLVAGRAITAVVICGGLFGFLKLVTALGRTATWVIFEVVMILLFSWMRTNLAKARAGGAAPAVVWKYQRGAFVLGLFVILIAARLILHAY